MNRLRVSLVTWSVVAFSLYLKFLSSSVYQLFTEISYKVAASLTIAVPKCEKSPKKRMVIAGMELVSVFENRHWHLYGVV